MKHNGAKLFIPTIAIKIQIANMVEHQIRMLEDTEGNAGGQAPNKRVNKDNFSDSQSMGI